MSMSPLMSSGKISSAVPHTEKLNELFVSPACAFSMNETSPMLVGPLSDATETLTASVAVVFASCSFLFCSFDVEAALHPLKIASTQHNSAHTNSGFTCLACGTVACAAGVTRAACATCFVCSAGACAAGVTQAACAARGACVADVTRAACVA